MKTDKELLILAAKASGLNVKLISVDIDDNVDGIIVGEKNTKNKTKWAPLHDDGDALRLSVKLHLEIAPACYSQDCVNVYSKDDNPVMELFEGDPYAATRRAIVRAAAAIGEKL